MKNVKKWLQDHKAISVRHVEQEAGIPQSVLNKVVNGHRELPKIYHARLLEVLKQYGFKHDSL
jgi:predicted transcriptional regulator